MPWGVPQWYPNLWVLPSVPGNGEATPICHFHRVVEIFATRALNRLLLHRLVHKGDNISWARCRWIQGLLYPSLWRSSQPELTFWMEMVQNYWLNLEGSIRLNLKGSHIWDIWDIMGSCGSLGGPLFFEPSSNADERHCHSMCLPSIPHVWHPNHFPSHRHQADQSCYTVTPSSRNTKRTALASKFRLWMGFIRP